MIRFVVFSAAVSLAGPTLAQDQQAGIAASTDTEGTFQALIDACDDVDALMLRARIRLQIPRTSEEAGAEAQTMLDEAFAQCGGGDIDGAKTKLEEALAVAEAGVDEVFATEAAASADTAAAEETPAATEDQDKPWWRFW